MFIFFKNRHSLVPRPDIENAVGYTVEVKSTEEGADDDDFFVGVVQSVSIIKQTILVMFEAPEGYEADVEEIMYESSDVCWMYEPNK